jgi:hypothetical protein
MAEQEYLLLALQDLGYSYEEGQLDVHGFGGQHVRVEVKIPTQNRGYEIGFRHVDGVYEIVADWWGIRDIDREQFQQQLAQRYAYHAARTRLAQQGFNLVGEEVGEDGRIHLVLRRLA